MKRILSLSLFILLLFCFTTNCIYAQVRASKEVPKLVKKASRTEAFQFASFGFGWKSVPYEFVSLKDLDKLALTDTEKNLLNTFADVAFCFKGSKVHCCYWVKDADGKVGLVKFDGSILVPPVKGNILQGTHPDRVVIGEETVNPNAWLEVLNANTAVRNPRVQRNLLTNVRSHNVNAQLRKRAENTILYVNK